jgi:hypothetical protein
MADVRNKIEMALEAAAERIINAVAESFATTAAASSGAAASGSSESATGAQAGAGGTSGQSGQVTQGAAGEVKTKDDVAAPEVIEALNVHSLKDAAIANKGLVDAQVSRFASNAKLFDVTATALGFATLGAGHNQSLHQQMASDHRDQNHDRQINLNETDISAAATLARLIERLNNPTPPAE